MQPVCNGLGRGVVAKLSGSSYKYAPAGKMEPAPGRSGPYVELPATVYCLLAAFGALPVRDRWHLARFNGLPETIISHPETFVALPVVVISYAETFNAHPVTEIGHLDMFNTLPVTVNCIFPGGDQHP
jgi:hypothetical protein